MKKFESHFQTYCPEQCAVSFKSTGTLDEDTGPQGNAALKFSENGSYMNIQVELTLSTGEKKEFGFLKDITLTACGNQELEGFAIALMDLGRKLLSRDDVLKDYIKWDSPESALSYDYETRNILSVDK